MYAVYDDKNKMRFLTTTDGACEDYVREVSVCVDTSRWCILPVDLDADYVIDEEI